MDLLLLGIAFLAGGLTILAPCVLPLLPVIIGGTAASQDKWRPLIVTTSLAVSVIVFTLLLKVSTLFIDIPQSAWSYVSGGILIVIGLFMFFPKLWSFIAYKSGFEGGSGKLLNVAGGTNSRWSGVLMGAALGPVFSSCSPTYFVILATVLPVSFAAGTVYLLAYALGLAIVLGLIALLGQRLIIKLHWAANPNGLFKKIMAILILAVGLLLVTGTEKKLQSAILDAGFGITTIEERLLDMLEEKEL